MKDEGSRNACRYGNDSAPAPVRENAKGEYYQGSQYCDFDKDRSHGPAPSLRTIRLTNTAIWAARDPLSSPGGCCNGPMTSLVQASNSFGRRQDPERAFRAQHIRNARPLECELTQTRRCGLGWGSKGIVQGIVQGNRLKAAAAEGRS
jgi:hypothetical protein